MRSEWVRSALKIVLAVLVVTAFAGVATAQEASPATDQETAEEARPVAVGEITVTARKDSGEAVEFKARVRIDTPKEREYFRNGGILHYVLRQLAGSAAAA